MNPEIGPSSYHARRDRERPEVSRAVLAVEAVAALGAAVNNVRELAAKLHELDTYGLIPNSAPLNDVHAAMRELHHVAVSLMTADELPQLVQSAGNVELLRRELERAYAQSIPDPAPTPHNEREHSQRVSDSGEPRTTWHKAAVPYRCRCLTPEPYTVDRETCSKCGGRVAV